MAAEARHYQVSLPRSCTPRKSTAPSQLGPYIGKTSLYSMGNLFQFLNNRRKDEFLKAFPAQQSKFLSLSLACKAM